MNSKSPLIPMEDFFRNPEKSSFRISPDGKHIAYMKPWKTRMNVHVVNIETDVEKRLTSSENRSIYGFLWLNNERIWYRPRYKQGQGIKSIAVFGAMNMRFKKTFKLKFGPINIMIYFFGTEID